MFDLKSMMNKSIKVYIADDHNIIAQGLGALIQQIPEVEKVLIFDDGKQLYEACRTSLPDVVFLDFEMPNWNGRKTLIELKALYPKLHCIILSMYNEKEIIDDCIKKGASGYLNKDCTIDELREAIQNPDEVYFSKGVLQHLSGYTKNNNSSSSYNSPLLTEREYEVLSLLCEGLTPKEIGLKIFISHRTVETHKTSIMEKFGVNSVGKLISVAYKNKIV